MEYPYFTMMSKLSCLPDIVLFLSFIDLTSYMVYIIYIIYIFITYRDKGTKIYI